MKLHFYGKLLIKNNNKKIKTLLYSSLERVCSAHLSPHLEAPHIISKLTSNPISFNRFLSLSNFAFVIPFQSLKTLSKKVH